MTAKEQNQLLANYIMAEIPGEPSQSEGPGICAMRLLRQYREGFEKIMAELGVPDENYPANVANAYEIAKHCFWGNVSEKQVSREKRELKSRRDLLKQICVEA